MAGQAGLGSVGDEQSRATSLLSSQILGLETPGLQPWADFPEDRVGQCRSGGM